MTAEEALSLLRSAGCNPHVEGDHLVLDADPPATIDDDRLDILHTGIVAILTGRPLIGIDECGRGCVRADGRLDPSHPFPANVRLVCVAGGRWDRVSPYAADDFPELFADTGAMRRAAV